MKILVATPIHDSKEYALQKWLKSVAGVQKNYPVDLLIVDNSQGKDFAEKIKKACQKLGIKNYQIKHIELDADCERFERMARSREIIRNEILTHDYDAWFSWESDILIQPNALTKLTKLMKDSGSQVVDHNCWMRGGFDGEYCTDFGIALIARRALERYGFILDFNSDPEMPKTYDPSEAWFKRRILRDGGTCIEVDGMIGPVIHLNVKASPKMKILIGTPIHEVKDYSMDRWFDNIHRLEHPADLFMVDNSPNTDYMEKVKAYCDKHRITNYKLVHLELPASQDKYERIARSREVIREEFLSKDYDAWFAWDCDQIVPTNALDKLIAIMKDGNYLMVNPNKWARENNTLTNTDFGCCLIKREALEKYSFILDFGSDPEMPDNWEPGEAWFKRRVLRGGGSYADVYGAIGPIYHLNS